MLAALARGLGLVSGSWSVFLGLHCSALQETWCLPAAAVQGKVMAAEEIVMPRSRSWSLRICLVSRICFSQYLFSGPT